MTCKLRQKINKYYTICDLKVGYIILYICILVTIISFGAVADFKIIPMHYKCLKAICFKKQKQLLNKPSVNINTCCINSYDISVRLIWTFLSPLCDNISLKPIQTRLNTTGLGYLNPANNMESITWYAIPDTQYVRHLLRRMT